MNKTQKRKPQPRPPQAGLCVQDWHQKELIQATACAKHMPLVHNRAEWPAAWFYPWLTNPTHQKRVSVPKENELSIFRLNRHVCHSSHTGFHGVLGLMAGSLPTFPVSRPFSRLTLRKDQTYVPKKRNQWQIARIIHLVGWVIKDCFHRKASTMKEKGQENRSQDK